MTDKSLLVARRGVIKGQLTRFLTAVQSVGENDDMCQLKIRREKVEEAWHEFQQIQDKIEALSTNNKDEEEKRIEFENTYFHVVAEYEKLLNTRNPTNEITNNVNKMAIENANDISASNKSYQSSMVKLSALNVPEFNGEYEKWSSFCDMFVALIHSNEALSDVQKFFYLKEALIGDAKKITQCFEVNDKNYKIAWKNLNERYNNKRILVQARIKAIFDLEPINNDCSNKLRNFIDSFNSHMQALESMDYEPYQWSPILLHVVTTKMNSDTLRAWETIASKTEVPKIDEFITFLKDRFQILEAVENANIQTKGRELRIEKFTNNRMTKNKQFQRRTAVNLSTSKLKCYVCEGEHPIYRCKQFLDDSSSNRNQIIRNLNLCENCLSRHADKKCKFRGCRKCGKMHNTLLHNDDPLPSTSINQSLSVSTHAATNYRTQILLSTAIINIYDKFNKPIAVRALLDSGSQSNFITEQLARRLGNPMKKINCSIHGVDGTKSKSSNTITATIKSITTSYQDIIEFLTLPNITSNLPSEKFDSSKFKLPNYIKLADPSYAVPGKIDVLLGAEIFYQLLGEGTFKHSSKGPIFKETKLGWVVSGPVCVSTPNQTLSFFCQNQIIIEEQMTKFWKIEDYPMGKVFSREEKECVTHFKNTVNRGADGKFIVELPFINNRRTLGDSRKIALHRFLSLEKRLQSDDNIKKQYMDFMKEYENLGHMETIPKNELNEEEESYYLPHHAVCRDSLTTKLRVVFDASCQSSTGQSLNDILLKGPCIQQDLICIISRFRTHRYVFSADIEKMYRQIWVDSKNCKFQKILWRSNPEDNIQEYRLKTITYGTKPASFLATACLKKLADDESDIRTVTYQTIVHDYYMDDLLSGSDSIDNAILLCNDIINIMSKAGFALRKWVTNEQKILHGLGLSNNQPMQILDLNGKSMKTLGLFWNPIKDTYGYEVNHILNKNNSITKRSVLSLIATLFDPLGLIGPVIVQAKLIMQALWKLMINWDELLPIKLRDEWLSYRNQLKYIRDINIPRRIIAVDNVYKIQIHGFADASTLAYGACLYLRVTDIDGNSYLRLIVAKSRVAPLKSMSIPKLELCGALLLARLAHKVIPELRLKIDRKCFWTDSTIVLAWLKSESSRWKIFVAHRVAEIQELTLPTEWRHVLSNDNPADVISRGCDALHLNKNELWWNGPSWLSADEKLWPCNSELSIISTNDIPEAKVETNINTSTVLDNEFSLMTKYSSLQKLYRITAYIKRWKSLIIDKLKFVDTTINVNEIANAEIAIIKLIQRQYFYEEINLLRKAKLVKKNSSLYFLNPFIDDHNILRVGGRLRCAVSLSPDQRQPIVIPASSHYTKLLFRFEHERLIHAGPQALLASIRDRFWPLNGRNIARITVHNCIRCFKVKPTVIKPIMGDLPKQRVEQSRVFENCGIDFAGPIAIKSSLKRKATILKSYICVFICFSTKAVHIEAVGDLTTNSFLAALRRFWSRRGIGSNIYSDNATNFVGASRQLKELKQLFMSPKHQNQLQNCLAEVRVKWNFIPAHSPHFGGLWESSIKSIKGHFRKYLGNALLTFEELTTVLTQIEACINSRPLFPLSSDPNDLSVLTPAHFLVGGPLTSIPESDVTEANPNRLRRWQRVSQLTQQLWKRWRIEYLSQLQSRHKWQRGDPNLPLGSLVLVKDDNQPPLNWKLGRVTALHPGSDGIVRAVTIRIGQGETRRAVRNLCPLPKSD